MPDSPSSEQTHAPAGPLARRLAAIPQPALAGGLIAVVALGLVLGGSVGTALLILGLGVFTLLLGLGWSAITQSERLLRIAVLVFLVALAIVRLVPR